MTLESINPYTKEKIATFNEMSLVEVNNIILNTQSAFVKWRKNDILERSKLIKKIAEILKKNSANLAELMTREMGKPINQSRSEIEKCAWLCDYFSLEAKNFLKPKIINTDASKSFVAYEPLGIVLGIMPWNFPFWQVFRFAIPALAAGNGALLKHASNVCGCALKIEEIFKEAGFPAHIFRTLLIEKNNIDNVIEGPFVKGVTLTGSVAAGKAVAKKAGEQIKKTVLELGGSDAYVVLNDADIKNAAKICVQSRTINSGQSCIAAKRFIVEEGVRKKFEELVILEMKAKKMGNPMDENTDIGPLARNDLRDDLHHQVLMSIDKGANCLLGGKIPKQKGYFYPPTVISGIAKGMPAYEEELFGPVAVIISAKDEEEAINIANDSIFGLGACVFTKDSAKGQKIAQNEIDAGSCFVNNFVRSDPRLPFGGVKQSGYGRELSSFGIKEFVNIKTVYVD